MFNKKSKVSNYHKVNNSVPPPVNGRYEALATGPDEGFQKAKRLVIQRYNAQAKKSIDSGVESPLTLDEVYVVTFTTRLQNWTALVGLVKDDETIFEVIYNGDLHEAYVSAFNQIDFAVIPDKSEK